MTKKSKISQYLSNYCSKFINTDKLPELTFFHAPAHMFLKHILLQKLYQYLKIHRDFKDKGCVWIRI
jgi:hypothetical protein